MLTPSSKKVITNPQAGFTLVEMLVSLALFTVVLTMSVGTLLVVIDANSKAQSMQLVMTNLSFTLDSMTREIRTGVDWHCNKTNAAPNVPEADSSDTDATQDCGWNPGGGDNLQHNGNSISINEVDGSLTKDVASSRITYYFDDNYHPNGNGAILRALGGDGGAPEQGYIALTGPEIDIQDVELTVIGTDRFVHGSNVYQPVMTLFIKGSVELEALGMEESFSLQTSVTQRVLDI